jgi:DNA polymerase (family 10)
MSTNAELSRIFSEMAQVLELTGANPFRVSAHQRVSRVLGELTSNVAELADDPKKLTAIDGIGDGSARKIIEFVRTGKVAEHDELIAQIPRGLLDVMRIPGLGPKTVKLLWEQGGVVDLATLKSRLESGELEGLKRMGAKTVQNIRDSLQFASQTTERMRLGAAMPLAEGIIAHLRGVKSAGVRQIEFAGSLRRGAETIGDIDILATAADPATLAKAFRDMSNVTKVLVSGDVKSSVRLAAGVQVDLRIVDDGAFGAALMYFTGSKAHNIALREIAIKKKLRLNEYGLFPAASDSEADDGPPQKRGVKPVAGKTETEIYRKLGFDYIPPELREARGELDRDVPQLVEFADIKCELHAHTTASDGALSIDELIDEAQRRGFHTIAVTDHSKASAQANGLSVARLLRHIDDIREAATRHKGIAVLVGTEVDILADGRLDYDDDLLAKLDIVIASPHSSLKQEPKKATERLLRAIRHPLVRIIGHPTGRIINRRPGMGPDINAMIAAALEHNTALEINANSWRLDLRDVHVKAAVDAGALIAINTDAHTVEDFDQLRYGVLTARRGWLTPDMCINTWSKAKLAKWLTAKREMRY